MAFYKLLGLDTYNSSLPTAHSHSKTPRQAMARYRMFSKAYGIFRMFMVLFCMFWYVFVCCGMFSIFFMFSYFLYVFVFFGMFSYFGTFAPTTRNNLL